jgi:enoyl-CoA hydratase/carnithine racemase
MSAPIRLEMRPPFARMILDRPERLNALDQESWIAIPKLVAEVEADPAVKILLVSGADDRAFAAGADISEFPALMTGGAEAYSAAMERATDALAGLSKPSIAVIQGACVGGGVALALCCDFRFAATSARFGVTPARLGVAYKLGDAKRLIDAVGLAHARDMLMTGRIMGSGEAAQIGLIDRALPADRLWPEAEAYAQTLAGLSQYAIRAAKSVIADILAGAAQETDRSRRLFIDAFTGEDLVEGARAFLEKRPPRFMFS